MTVTDAGATGFTTATVRAVVGARDSSARADHLAERLAEAIQIGLILDGERFPPEAQLADELGTATVTLREALARLRERGLVATRRGRGGGTYVTSAQPGQDGTRSTDALLRQRFLGFSVQDLRELGDHRRAISAMCATLAAERALPEDVSALERRLELLRAAVQVSDRRRADTQLAIEVAAAAQSSTLTREELALHSRVGDLLWWGSDGAHHATVVAARQKLIGAIGRGNPSKARQLAEAAIQLDTERLIGRRLQLYAGQV